MIRPNFTGTDYRRLDQLNRRKPNPLGGNDREEAVEHSRLIHAHTAFMCWLIDHGTVQEQVQ